MFDRVRFFFHRVRERLWVRPMLICLVSVVAALMAKGFDEVGFLRFLPSIPPETIESLLKIMSSSMLVIATFAVGSMVSAYAAASSTATPRSFPLVIADDVSQNALSSFIGAFIFSIVGLIAYSNGYYDTNGRFALFMMTLLVFGVVIVTFVRWVDCIARLGRLGNTIDRVEGATREAVEKRRRAPRLGGVASVSGGEGGHAIYGEQVGYVQRVDGEHLQHCAEEADVVVVVVALPGTLAVPDRPLAYVRGQGVEGGAFRAERFLEAFEIGEDRTFDEDPRFGLIVLSEIAGRALSPAVNDPGTAIDIIGSMVRLFVLWSEPVDADAEKDGIRDRVEVPLISVEEMFDDAFTAIARDGAGVVEVAVRLQKALRTLESVGDAEMREAARRHARLALARCERAMELPEDLAVVRRNSSAEGGG